MSVDLVVQIFDTVPTARHLKDEAAAGNGPLHRITEIRRRTNDGLKVFSGQGVRTMIAEMELGFSGHCPYVALADVYAAAFDLWHGGQKREAFDMFGRILAFSSLGTMDPNAILVARGVFKPGVRSRSEPPAAKSAGTGGGAASARPALHLDEDAIRTALDHYLKPWLRA
jgi:dihydrodipicolinate synthase/N-acetylneuraminate lyase